MLTKSQQQRINRRPEVAIGIKKVLFVGDDAVNADLVERHCESLGIECPSMAHGREQDMTSELDAVVIDLDHVILGDFADLAKCIRAAQKRGMWVVVFGYQESYPFVGSLIGLPGLIVVRSPTDALGVIATLPVRRQPRAA